nr:MBOAT family protein [Chthonobacter rhizosphaerae]
MGFHLLIMAGRAHAALLWLTVASIVFYSWWEPSHLPVLLGTVVGNYWLGETLRAGSGTGKAGGRLMLGLGVAANLAVLGLFKYSAFFVNEVTSLGGIDYTMRAFVLPLGISFYTFQQIAYLVDCAQKKAAASSFTEYLLFVAFFPQLIAGPIVHHGDVLPQFRTILEDRVNAANFARGLSFFVIGLFKKVVIADDMAVRADLLFADPTAMAGAGFLDAWTGVLAYTLQLYFDFSGYSDMAIGLALMCGIRIPYNFDSPYKATSIIDFWRRWHMTLSRFLRDYLYIPLGGNRKGPIRRYMNLFLTMLLGGFWHGANWTFLIWGTLHGTYLIINHGWMALRERLGLTWDDDALLPKLAARSITLVAVMIAWVFFRATSVGDAMDILTGMAGLNGLGTLRGSLLVGIALMAAAWVLPNSQEIVDGVAKASGRLSSLRWQPSPVWAAALAACFLLAVSQMTNVSAFIYFQF